MDNSLSLQNPLTVLVTTRKSEGYTNDQSYVTISLILQLIFD